MPPLAPWSGSGPTRAGPAGAGPGPGCVAGGSGRGGAGLGWGLGWTNEAWAHGADLGPARASACALSGGEREWARGMDSRMHVWWRHGGSAAGASLPPLVRRDGHGKAWCESLRAGTANKSAPPLDLWAPLSRRRARHVTRTGTPARASLVRASHQSPAASRPPIRARPRRHPPRPAVTVAAAGCQSRRARARRGPSARGRTGACRARLAAETPAECARDAGKESRPVRS